MWSTDVQVRGGHQLILFYNLSNEACLVLPTSEQWKTTATLALWPDLLEERLALTTAKYHGNILVPEYFLTNG